MVKVYGPSTLTGRVCSPLSSVMPRTSVNLTKSPSSRLCRDSSSTVTSPASSCVTEATIALTGSSPVVSCTSKASPKSQKSPPKRPNVSARMKRLPARRHASLIAIAFASGVSVRTTMPNWLAYSGVSSPLYSETGTYWLSSASRGTEASARPRPTSASFRKNCADRSERATGVGSCSVTDLTPPSTTFLAISIPRPLRPTMSTVDAAIRRIASWPSTYS
mmetsp:Transcript_39216/g.86190  ORF Transcript_39216/g.86190 Transcript_39216/m.86190 type:complete len:220 (-) Transcript_39216:208-867(-)